MNIISEQKLYEVYVQRTYTLYFFVGCALVGLVIYGSRALDGFILVDKTDYWNIFPAVCFFTVMVFFIVKATQMESDARQMENLKKTEEIVNA